MHDSTLNLYVSPAGNDMWSGTLSTPAVDGADGPFATAAGARDAIRRYKASSGGLDRPVTVHFAAGVYELAETLSFTPEDGGTAGCPVRYVAAEGAAPVISGGRRITGLRETEHNGIRCWVADLSEVAAGRWYFTRLYANDSARRRPRLPKSGFHHFTGLAGCGDSGFKWGTGPDRANFAAGDIRLWHNWKDVELVSYQLWFDTHHRFKAIDEAAGLVQFQAKSLGSLKDERGEFARYYVDNVFEALDTPGEWYLDRVSGRLTYLPLPDEKLETTVLMAPRLAELVSIRGEGSRRAGHLRFESLVFAHQQWELPLDCTGYIQAAFGVPGAVILQGAEHCVFYGCTVAHINGYGIEVLAGSTENTVAACVINDAGGGGIKIGHEELTPHEAAVGENQAGECPSLATTVADCTIRDCGHLFPGAIGIWIGNSGWNRVVHNHIFNCTYTGISCGWTWGYSPARTVANRIEYNHIHHINHNEILSDNGGIYTLGQQPGTTLRGNLIHDIACYGYGGWGIYPDEGSSEMRVEQNVVAGTKKCSFMTHYGRDNLVQNNIFALSQADHLSLGKRETHRSNTFRRNIVVTAGGRICGGFWDTPHFTAMDNLFWTVDGTPLVFSGESLEALQARGQNVGAVVADPLFADAAGGDFSLRSDSPAMATGFKPFSWRSAGVRVAAERPADYDAYNRRFPVPSSDVPVVRTKIELLGSEGDIISGGCAGFTVTLSNVGRAPGRGVLKLSSGPKGIAGRPDITRIAYDLAPGASMTERVKLKVRVRVGLPTFWLDSEPTGAGAVPARGLVVGEGGSRWTAALAGKVKAPEAVGRAVARVPARKIVRGGRTVAEVRLAAGEDGLLLFARMYETTLRPDLEQPWLGTAIELISFQEARADAPAGQPLVRNQVFLVPRAGGTGADGRQLDEPNKRAVPAPEIRVGATPVADGCELAAIVPWTALGFDRPPEKVQFQMIVDIVDQSTGKIVQCLAMDPLSDGWKTLPAHLVLPVGRG
ncbi:MAG: right-handed parallel beta-helix repeat-containing protein [bacterium]